MQFKSSVLRTPLFSSLSLHVLAGILIFLVIWSGKYQKNITFDFDVVFAPSVSSNAVINEPVQPKVMPAPDTKKAVFGISNKTILDTSGAGEEIKKGNTIAKQVDTKTLTDGDPNSLPIPSEEYLVSQMPVLLNEVRVPYPEQAKKQRIQGDVVLFVLIDKQGNVRQVDIDSGPGYGLEEAAQKALIQFKFKPAHIEDQPVAVKVRYVYKFVLEK